MFIHGRSMPQLAQPKRCVGRACVVGVTLLSFPWFLLDEISEFRLFRSLKKKWLLRDPIRTSQVQQLPHLLVRDGFSWFRNESKSIILHVAMELNSAGLLKMACWPIRFSIIPNGKPLQRTPVRCVTEGKDSGLLLISPGWHLRCPLSDPLLQVYNFCGHLSLNKLKRTNKVRSWLRTVKVLNGCCHGQRSTLLGCESFLWPIFSE